MKRTILGVDDDKAILHFEHDGDAGVLRLQVPVSLWEGATVGASVEIPDDLSSAEATAMGFFKLEL